MRKYALWSTVAIIAAVAFSGSMLACGNGKDTTGDSVATPSKADALADSVRMHILHQDSIEALEADSTSRYDHLTYADFKLVADELGIEVAAMKAVVEIEAGKAMKGFAAPGVPIVNFDGSMYKIYASKAPDKKGNPDAKVPEGLSGHQLSEWTQLTAHRKKNAQGADMGSFWGMFQIGGFNYKLCGFDSVDEFVERMSDSELAQLEIFAEFVKNTGYLEFLKKKDWAGFSRKYNGKSYKKRKYDSRMAAAYARYKKEEGKAASR